MIKKNVIITLFFLTIIIASCITFNNQKNIQFYDYNREMFLSNASFWGQPMLYELDHKIPNKSGLLALIKDDKLTYIVSNEYNHFHRYKYSKLNDTSHILVKQKNKAPIFSRGSYNFTDSILFTTNFCFIKNGNFESQPSNNIHYNKNFTFYFKDKYNIYCYDYFHKNKEEPYIELNNCNLKDVSQYFANENFSRISKNIELKRTIPIVANANENTLDAFFRTQIMNFSYKKK